MNSRERGPSIEEIEEKVYQEEQEALAGKGEVGKIRAWFTRMMDRVTDMGLPDGLSLDDYRRITRMYKEIKDNVRGGKFVKAKHWARIIKKDPAEQKGLLETIADEGAGVNINKNADILDFLLDRYLPHAMNDNMTARRIRTFFMFDLQIMPEAS